MDLKQNPFSLYDFLGYFTPGAIFMYCVLLALGHLETKSFSLMYINNYLSFDHGEVYIPFVLGAYFLGHFLSFISSITIERFSIWAHGYPSKYLLGIAHNGYFHVSENKALRKTIRTFVRCAPRRAKRGRVVRGSRASRGVKPLWAGAVRRTAGRPRPADGEAAGRIRAVPEGRERDWEVLSRHTEGRRTRFAILAPISFLDLLLGKTIGLRDLYAKKLDPLLITVLRERTEALIERHAGIQNKQQHGQARDVDFFRYAYHYALENAPNHLDVPPYLSSTPI